LILLQYSDEKLPHKEKKNKAWETVVKVITVNKKKAERERQEEPDQAM